jgi:3-isopropylmalate/(R)-2-methylmalate dehydratase large subunit
MTGPEKIIARVSGRPWVRPGDIVVARPDAAMVHDNVLPGIRRMLDDLGIDRLAEPEKVILVTDHEVLYGSPRAALYGAIGRQAARQWRVGRFFDVGRGGHGHVFPMETGIVRPGMFSFGSAWKWRGCWRPGPTG